MSTSYFFNPVEESVKRVLQGSHLSVTENQYVPWLDVPTLNNSSPFPVVACANLATRVDPHSTYAETDVLIAIYDLIPSPDFVVEKGDLALQAAISQNRYQSDLLQITDMLGNVDEQNMMFVAQDYGWVSQRVFKPLFREGLYNTKESQKSHKISDKLYAATVTGTLRGRMQHICCVPKFGQTLVPEVVSVSRDNLSVTLYLRRDPNVENIRVYEDTSSTLIYNALQSGQGRTISVDVILSDPTETVLSVEYVDTHGRVSDQAKVSV